MALIDTEQEVLKRYAAASQSPEGALCCAVSYDPKYLAVIPEEILDCDYGCGDPSQHVREGETVLDLGCGSAKLCYIASQIVGPTGRVIGIDFNPPMLALARRHHNAIAERIGWDNVTFHRARIQDLGTDLDALERLIAEHPVKNLEDYEAVEEARRNMVASSPLIADQSIDIVLSNCVLNLVRPEDKGQLFREIYRVLKRGGRLAISDIVSDQEVPAHLRNDPDLWSGCVSGAFQEREFLRAFEQAGFYGIHCVKRDEAPWQTVDGIEFRSMTVIAYKGKDGPGLERNQAVIYQGPWSQVHDDDGHVLERGVPMAVCDKTFRIYTSEPYRDHIIPIPPRHEVPLDQAAPFDWARSKIRRPSETKGRDDKETTAAPVQCCPDDDDCSA